MIRSGSEISNGNSKSACDNKSTSMNKDSNNVSIYLLFNLYFQNFFKEKNIAYIIITYIKFDTWLVKYFRVLLQNAKIKFLTDDMLMTTS